MAEELQPSERNYHMQNMEGSTPQFDTSNKSNPPPYDHSSNMLQVVTVTHSNQPIATLTANPSIPLVNGLLCNYNTQLGLNNQNVPKESNWNGVTIQEINNDQNVSVASPASTEDKTSWFFESFSIQLSKLYGVLLVMCGLTFYIGDSYMGNLFVLAEGFNLYLMVVQLVFLLYIQFDVRKFLDEQKENPKSVGNNPEDQRYGFSSSRHGGSLYLKIGATSFAFGYLMYIGLDTGLIILHSDVDGCYSRTDLAMSIFHIIHVFYQLFFLFKYSNLIINRWVFATRFGLMHCIATSICLWIYMIYEEILYSVTQHEGEHYPVQPLEPIHPTGNLTTVASMTIPPSWQIQASNCKGNSSLEDTINVLSPFIYPLCVEFNLLIVGLWICIYQNLGKIEKHDKLPSIQIVDEENASAQFQSNLIISVDCHSSNRGLFIGLLVAIVTLISIIIIFVFTNSEDLYGTQMYITGMYLRSITELGLLLSLTITVIIAYKSIQQLDLIHHFISSVDKILLFLSHPFMFLFAFLNIVAYLQNVNNDASYDNYSYLVVMCFYIVQPVIQTLFICDGLRRCSNSVDLQHKKPGREVVTYLVVTNITMWLLESLQMNTHGANEKGIDFYGESMWRNLVHVTMPLSLFYRFHSSVCIADIWADAYVAE